MNLVWLKFVSYALLAGAAVLYFSIRLNKFSLSRAAKVALYVVCVALACLLWQLQERNSDLYSPRQLAIGTVISVTTHRHRGGEIDDTFRLRLQSGQESPPFTTGNSVAHSVAQQPIHPGDLLGVLYRTWDDVPLTIDEIQGQQAGWRYHRVQGALSLFVWTTAFVGLLSLAGALAASRTLTRQTAASESGLHRND